MNAEIDYMKIIELIEMKQKDPEKYEKFLEDFESISTDLALIAGRVSIKLMTNPEFEKCFK